MWLDMLMYDHYLFRTGCRVVVAGVLVVLEALLRLL
jgi:hypothetical protein